MHKISRVRPSVRPSVCFSMSVRVFQCPSTSFSMSVRAIPLILLKTIKNQQKHKMIHLKNGEKHRFDIFVWRSLQRRFWRDWHGSIGLTARFQSVLLASKTATCRVAEKNVLFVSFLGRNFDHKSTSENRHSEISHFYGRKTDPTKTDLFRSSLPHRFWREWHRSKADTEPCRSVLVSPNE